MSDDLIERLRVFADRLADLGERYSRRGWPQAASVETGRACDITDVLSALESSQSLLARRTEALEPFARVGRALTGRTVSYTITAPSRMDAPLVGADDFRRASEALSDLGNDGARRG